MDFAVCSLVGEKVTKVLITKIEAFGKIREKVFDENPYIPPF